MLHTSTYFGIMKKMEEDWHLDPEVEHEDYEDSEEVTEPQREESLSASETTPANTKADEQAKYLMTAKAGIYSVC